MLLTRLVLALIIGALAFAATGLLARSWRRRGRKFTLRVGKEATSVVDEIEQEVLTIQNWVSYRRKKGSFELTAVGLAPASHPPGETINLGDMVNLDHEDAVQLFAAFAQYCLVRARREADVPLWRYATLGVQVDHELRLAGIASEARRSKALRYAIRDVGVSTPTS